MKDNEISFRLGAFFGVVAGVLGALVMSYTYFAKEHALEETKLALQLLSEKHAALTPQLREYLKGRVYSNTARWHGKGPLNGIRIDYGPVDRDALQGVDVDLHSPASMLYADAIDISSNVRIQ